jgi:aryl-alcohol dehydrogenase-like predicted oxidoreductase
MEYRQFGRTSIAVSAVGFGCWEVSGTYGPIDAAQFERAVHRALDDGINCFDTAEAYGMGISEGALGRALGSRRREVCVVTKVGVGYPEAPNRRDSSRARIMASLEQSLRNLDTDHVDVYLIHWPDLNTPFDETFRALDDIVRTGKARYIGVSNFRLSQLEDCMKLRRIDVVQYGWNVFDRRIQREIFPWCTANDVGVMAYGSLAYGMLTGTFHADMEFDEADWRSKRGALGSLNLFRTVFGPDHFARNLRAIEELKPLAAKYARPSRSSRCAGRSAIPRSPPASLASATPRKSRRILARSTSRSRTKTWWRSMRSSRATTSSPNRPDGWRTIRPLEAHTEEAPCPSNVLLR